jgi:hypothetical protein
VINHPNQYALTFFLGIVLALFLVLYDLDVPPSFILCQLYTLIIDGGNLLQNFYPILLTFIILVIILLILHINFISGAFFLYFKLIKNYIFNFFLIVNEFLEDINDLI